MVWLKRLGWLLLIAAILGGGASSLWWASEQAPEFYAVAEQQISDPKERKQVAQEFVEQSQYFVKEIKSQPEWTQEFTDAQINSWLAEEFPGEYRQWIPPEVSRPRVQIRKDGIRIGAKVDQAGPWNGIVSVHASVKVLTPNELAISLQSVHVGLVPVPLKTVIDEITAQAAAIGIEIEWRRDGDHDSAIVRIAHEGHEQPQLERIEFRDGTIRISGTSAPKSGALQFIPQRLTQRTAAATDEAAEEPLFR